MPKYNGKLYGFLVARLLHRTNNNNNNNNIKRHLTIARNNLLRFRWFFMVAGRSENLRFSTFTCFTFYVRKYVVRLSLPLSNVVEETRSTHQK